MPLIFYKTFADDKVAIPNEVDAFIREYEALCKKHRLMVLSEGEPVTVGEYEKDLWGIREYTAQDIQDRDRFKP